MLNSNCMIQAVAHWTQNGPSKPANFLLKLIFNFSFIFIKLKIRNLVKGVEVNFCGIVIGRLAGRLSSRKIRRAFFEKGCDTFFKVFGFTGFDLVFVFESKLPGKVVRERGVEHSLYSADRSGRGVR